MKAKFIALAALVLGLASCQQDFDAPVQMNGEVDFQLSVAATELAGTRAGENGAEDGQKAYDSAYGAIDYLQGGNGADDLRVDWAEVDLRYSLEVYDKADNYIDAVPVKDRMVQIVDSYEAVKFDLRLVPNRDYHFVVFADFVPNGASEDANVVYQSTLGLRHNIGDNLGDITIKSDAINDEIADAYFATSDIKITNSASQDMTLKRPYGKVRVIATDLAELNLNVNPDAVKVAYTAKHPQKFNAVTGNIEEYANEAYEFVYEYKDITSEVAKGGLQNHLYTAGYDAETVTNANGVERHTHMTLFTDYILAAEQTPIHFTMTVYDNLETGSVIKETVFNTDIPVERNMLTTVIGNVLTTATDINVTIDDNFETFYNYNLWNGLDVKEPENDGVNYYIYESSELAWLSQQVNEKNQKFNGKTFWLCKDLHLNHERWTPIGATGKFEGTFDGQGHKIEGLFVSVKGKADAGLFANAKYVKNLTVLNSQVYGQYKAGVIVANGVCSRITNCHVDGCEVVSTPYNKDEANNVGGIVGYLSGETEAYVKDCTVKNSRIVAYRKVGGIAGAANQTAEVSGNRVDNVVVVADMTAEYKEVKDADAGAIVGYVHAKATVENNTIGEGNSVTVFIDTDEERDQSYVKKDERVHVSFKEGEYNFTNNLEVNGAIQAMHGGEVVLNVNDKTITTGNNSDYGFIARGEGNTLVINNANVVSNGGGISATDNAKLVFNGNSVAVNATTTSGRYNIYTANGGEVVINGGTFSFDKPANRRAYVYANAGCKVTINGGTFGKPSTRSDYKAGILGAGEVIIYGGTFGFDPSAWVAQGYVAKKEGANWVVGLNKVENADELTEAIANASEGDYIYLTEDVEYGSIYLGELKNVTIEGAENASVRFVTTADSVIENVTVKDVAFEFVTGAGQKDGAFVVIDANASIEKLVIENCTIVGDNNKNSYGIYGQNPNASIVVKNCNFSNLGYAVQTISGGGYKSLNVENCSFNNIISWSIMPQYGYTGDLTVNGCSFTNCDGLVKTGAFGGIFTFTNNTLTNTNGHDGKDSKCFEVNANGTAVVAGNTKDGAAWTPGTEQGLK